MTTSLGEIWLRLTPDQTPKTVENFVGLTERGFYAGLIFHRVIPDFMIQGGDPLGTGTGGESIWGGDFADEFVPTLSNIRGSIAMANRGANTNSSQFFINQADNTFLDFKHTVFGQVVSGMSVVDQITNVERDANDKPAIDVTMQVQVFKVVE
ncbi:MAG: peptidylprolyl isomerase [Patescibacteria group bacterium]